MARQARAEITRDSVLAGAADVFLRLGYANASLSEIIAQSNVTKGALYFHFGSKEELARAVVDQGHERLVSSCQGFFDSRVPALEACIGITYVVADLSMNDPMVGAMLKLTHQIGDYRGANGENISKTWGGDLPGSHRTGDRAGGPTTRPRPGSDRAATARTHHRGAYRRGRHRNRGPDGDPDGTCLVLPTPLDRPGRQTLLLPRIRRSPPPPLRAVTMAIPSARRIRDDATAGGDGAGGGGAGGKGIGVGI